MFSEKLKKVIRKKFYIVITGLVIILSFPFLIDGVYGVDTLTLFIYWGGISSVSIFFVFHFLHKETAKVICPHCKINLFALSEFSSYHKIDFIFCPSCGGSLVEMEKDLVREC